MEVCTALTQIPNGDPLWRTLGGARALSDVDLSRIELSHLIMTQIHNQSDSKKKRPQPEKPPPIYIEEERKRAKHRSKVRNKMDKRGRLSQEDLIAFYKKQAEVDKNGNEHAAL